jgi:glycosyltransferase involved in cell wall biosynthesis
MPEIIFFTKYSNKGPSSRYRTFNYLPFFEKKYDIKVYSLFDDQYIDILYSVSRKISPFYVINSYFKRIFQLLTISKKNNIVVIEYELFPYFFPIFEYLLKWRRVKFVLDYDDAIFHNYDSSSNKIVKYLFSNKLANISKIANHIITGSPYLTKYFLQFNKCVTEIPTSIQFEKYTNINNIINLDNSFTIGWLGSNSTSQNLIYLIPVFQKISVKYPNVIFAFCGISNDVISNFKNINFTITDWSLSNELQFLHNIQVGIMPLELNKFNNGKCGFKLIQYMAMGKPTISTPLEANVKIDHENGNLFANTQEEWYKSFENIIQNYDNYKNIGYKNIEIVKNEYSIEHNHKKYLEIFKDLNL